jgi:hypothetical protein
MNRRRSSQSDGNANEAEAAKASLARGGVLDFNKRNWLPRHQRCICGN